MSIKQKTATILQTIFSTGCLAFLGGIEMEHKKQVLLMVICENITKNSIQLLRFLILFWPTF